MNNKKGFYLSFVGIVSCENIIYLSINYYTYLNY